jgi:hypothetical protein
VFVSPASYVSFNLIVFESGLIKNGYSVAAYKKLESTEKARCSRQSTADPAASGDQAA